MLVMLLITTGFVQAQEFNYNLKESVEVTFMSAKNAKKVFKFNNKTLYGRVKQKKDIYDLVGSDLHIIIFASELLINGHSHSEFKDVLEYTDVPRDVYVGIEVGLKTIQFAEFIKTLEKSTNIRSVSLYFYSDD